MIFPRRSSETSGDHRIRPTTCCPDDGPGYLSHSQCESQGSESPVWHGKSLLGMDPGKNSSTQPRWETHSADAFPHASPFHTSVRQAPPGTIELRHRRGTNPWRLCELRCCKRCADYRFEETAAEQILGDSASLRCCKRCAWNLRSDVCRTDPLDHRNV